MSQKQIFNLIALVLYAISTAMMFIFYDWKLAVIIFVFTTANNMGQASNHGLIKFKDSPKANKTIVYKSEG